MEHLLIQTCDIQQKTQTLNGYEQISDWQDVETDVKTRKDSSNSVKISDTDIRVNTDDDLFFFMPNTPIVRGNRILFQGEFYDVIKVNKILDSEEVHHIEAIARLTDNN